MSLQKTSQHSFQSHSLADTERIGRFIAAKLTLPACVYLEGGLGTGKTTLCKSIIQSLGCQDNVTSPTYNLVQQYPVAAGIIYHMDLYRVQSPEELEFLAISDLWCESSLFLIEWPKNGEQFLPRPTHRVEVKANQAESVSRDITLIENL